MISKPVFITHNKNKIREFKEFLAPEIEFEILELEYPELRCDDEEEVVALAAKQLADRLGRPVIVEDSGFHIVALSGFPGTCTAFVHKRIGNEGFLKLMNAEQDRRIFYKSAIGFCMPEGQPEVFSGVERGKMAFECLGDKGWGQDPIFIPENSDQTYGEHKPSVNIFREKALTQLKSFILSKK